MAKHLHQLDLFGVETVEPVTIKAPKEKLTVYKAPVETNQQALQEEALPTVSRTAMSFAKNVQLHKRGRKSFASMDAEIDTLKVPSAEELIKKLYYPIGEVAVWFNVNTSLIRYWEKEFKQLQPRKTRKGDRLFRAQDIEFLKQIYYLLREKKYSIEGAKNYLKNNKEKADKDISLLNSLKDIKTFLVSLKASL
jgi:DNA-binding transcriptional MerR regulator